MSAWQLLVTAGLVWLSGALFAAGMHDRSGAQRRRMRSYYVQKNGGVSPRWSPAPLVWWGVGAAVVWAMAVMLNELFSSHIWSLTQATYWTR